MVFATRPPERASRSLCKHIAAVLYGVGNRLDREPTLLFLLRGVDQQELVAEASAAALATPKPPRGGARRLANEALSGIFGIEIEEAGPTTAPAASPPPLAPPRVSVQNPSDSVPLAIQRSDGF